MRILELCLLLTALLGVLVPRPADAQPLTMRVSVGSGKIQANRTSVGQSLSADGRWVAFDSTASNLVPNDTNDTFDVFVHDRIGTAPVAPSGLVVDKIVGNVVTFRWTSPGFGSAPTNFVIEGGTAPGHAQAGLATGSTASNEVRIFVNVPVAPSTTAHLLALVNGSTLSLVWTNTCTGGEPTSLVLDVTGTITTSLPLNVQDSFSLADVPPGTYTVALRAQNAAGSSPPSNPVTLTFPGPCSGPPTSTAGAFLTAAWPDAR